MRKTEQNPTAELESAVLQYIRSVDFSRLGSAALGFSDVGASWFSERQQRGPACRGGVCRRIARQAALAVSRLWAAPSCRQAARLPAHGKSVCPEAAWNAKAVPRPPAAGTSAPVLPTVLGPSAGLLAAVSPNGERGDRKSQESPIPFWAWERNEV